MKYLTDTQNIPESSLLRIYKKGFGYAKLTVLINSDRFLAAGTAEDFMKKVKDGDRLDTYLWVENEASYEFKLTAVGRITIGDPILFFAHTDAIVRFEERKCLKAKVDIPINFFTFAPAEAGKALASKEIKLKSGTITELTDREVLLKTKEALPEGSFLFTTLDIGSEQIQLIGKYAKAGKNLYLTDINSLNQGDRTKLLEYILGIYRE